CCQSNRSSPRPRPRYSPDPARFALPATPCGRCRRCGRHVAPAASPRRRSAPGPVPPPSAPRGRGREESPADGACRPPSESTPAGPPPGDTFSPSVLGPVPPATAPDHTPRCPRTSARPRPVPPRCGGTVRRPRPARPDGTACRTVRRSDSWGTPSLWHAAPPGVSQPSVEVVGSSPISWLSLLQVLIWKQGPFPPPALPGFVGTMDLSDSHHRPACLSRASGLADQFGRGGGSPVLPANSPCRVPSSLPRWDQPGPVAFGLAGAAVPFGAEGRLPQLAFSGPARRSLTLWPANSLSGPRPPFDVEGSRPFVASRSTPTASWVTTFCQVWVSHPRELTDLFTAHARSASECILRPQRVLAPDRTTPPPPGARSPRAGGRGRGGWRWR